MGLLLYHFSNLYRGGSNIRANAGNNSSTNLAASVPTSGAINYTNFRSTAKGFRKTYTATATDQDASSIFGDDYGVDYPKEIVINSGVELGATSTSQEALQIDSGLSGTMTITNNGTLSGAGGSANGGAGGDAFEADVACTLINNGTIRAGGGGGGQGGSGGTGGTGGQGSTTSTTWSSYSQLGNPTSQSWLEIYGSTHYLYNGGNFATVSGSRSQVVNHGGYRYKAGSFHSSPGDYQYYFKLLRSTPTTNTSYHSGGSGGSGGAGGAGGRGQGYNHGSQNGSSGSGGSGGSAGGTNAGAGGTGEPAVQVATVVPTGTLAVTETQAQLAIPELMETTLMVAAALVALAARQVAQPVSTSVVYLTSHLRTMAQCKEARPNAVHNS